MKKTFIKRHDRKETFKKHFYIYACFIARPLFHLRVLLIVLHDIIMDLCIRMYKPE